MEDARKQAKKLFLSIIADLKADEDFDECMDYMCMQLEMIAREFYGKTVRSGAVKSPEHEESPLSEQPIDRFLKEALDRLPDYLLDVHTAGGQPQCAKEETPSGFNDLHTKGETPSGFKGENLMDLIARGGDLNARGGDLLAAAEEEALVDSLIERGPKPADVFAGLFKAYAEGKYLTCPEDEPSSQWKAIRQLFPDDNAENTPEQRVKLHEDFRRDLFYLRSERLIEDFREAILVELGFADAANTGTWPNHTRFLRELSRDVESTNSAVLSAAVCYVEDAEDWDAAMDTVLFDSEELAELQSELEVVLAPLTEEEKADFMILYS